MTQTPLLTYPMEPKRSLAVSARLVLIVAASLLVAVPFVSVWTVLGLLLFSIPIFSFAGGAVLGALAISTALIDVAVPYTSTVTDVAAVAAAVLLLVGVLIMWRPASWHAAVALDCAAAVYCLVKGSVQLHGSSSPALDVAAVSVAVVLLALQAALLCGMWSYASADGCASAERALLKSVLTLPPGTEPQHLDVAGLHAIVLGPIAHVADPHNALPIVIMHGYMAGAAMFCFNMEALAAQHRLYVVDWLGCGGSSRPPFTPRSTAEAEAWFLDSFESWRAAVGLERFILMGHSLGGMLVSAYAMRHPHRVAHLFLVSPAGIPDSPAVDPTAATGGMVPSDPKRSPTPRAIPAVLWTTVSWAWNHDFTPARGLRWLGPIGPWVTQAAIRRRASRWILARPFTEEQLTHLGTWFYHNLASRGSGEYALKLMLAPGVWARSPIGPRLVRAAKAAATRDTSGERYAGPVTFIYGGSYDWMNSKFGDEVVRELRKLGVKHCGCFNVSPGGHHLYLESPAAFNSLVLSEIAAAAVDDASSGGGDGGGGSIRSPEAVPPMSASTTTKR